MVWFKVLLQNHHLSGSFPGIICLKSKTSGTPSLHPGGWSPIRTGARSFKGSAFTLVIHWIRASGGTPQGHDSGSIFLESIGPQQTVTANRSDRTRNVQTRAGLHTRYPVCVLWSLSLIA